MITYDWLNEEDDSCDDNFPISSTTFATIFQSLLHSSNPDANTKFPIFSQIFDNGRTWVSQSIRLLVHPLMAKIWL